MANSDFPFIIVELVMTLGGALAFGWWQMRDLKKERLKTQLREQQAHDAAFQSSERERPTSD
jgi:hypothetical protein